MQFLAFLAFHLAISCISSIFDIVRCSLPHPTQITGTQSHPTYSTTVLQPSKMAFLIIILSAVRVPVLVCVNDLQFLKLGVKENLHPSCISSEVGRHFYLRMEIAVCQIAVEGKKKKEEEGDPRNWADQENAFFLERSEPALTS